MGVTKNVRQSIRNILDDTVAGGVQALFNRDGKGKKDESGNRKKRAFSQTEFYLCLQGTTITTTTTVVAAAATVVRVAASARHDATTCARVCMARR